MLLCVQHDKDLKRKPWADKTAGREYGLWAEASFCLDLCAKRMSSRCSVFVFFLIKQKEKRITKPRHLGLCYLMCF
jgi:hypothetical protein